MKRDIELQKPFTHTSIRLGKRESDQKIKCMILQKAKGYPIKEKYQKSFSKWDVIESKRSYVMTEKMESNVKLQVMLSSLMGGHIYILL